MEEGYYIPNISEFKKNFKFEYLDVQDYTFEMFSLDPRENNSLIKYHNEEWIPYICNWKYDSEDMFTEEVDGIKLTYSGTTKNFFSAFDDNRIINLIKDGRIRAKQ